MASRVDRRIALALPFLRIDKLAKVIPTFSASSVTLILRLASMTSMLIIIAIAIPLDRFRFLLLRLRQVGVVKYLLPR